jgi:hypothetical protein
MSTYDDYDNRRNDDRRGLLMRVFLAIPIIGWVTRDLLEGSSDTIYYLLAAIVSLLIIAVMTWGVQALSLVAVALVPVMFIVLIWLTWG